MANLSNINGKFVVEQTTGYVGVGTTDPNYPIEVLNASAEIALNASGASIYRLKSDSTDAFRINKNGVGDRLIIAGNGNATFSGSINAGGSPSITPNTNFDTLVVTESAHSGITILSGNTSDGAIYFGDPDFNGAGQIKYLHASNSMTFTTDNDNPTLTLDDGVNATFAGSVTAGSFVGAASTFDPMVTITYSDISTGENRGLRIVNTQGTEQIWNLTNGITGNNNEDFCIRDSTNNVNAFTLAKTSGNAEFSGSGSFAGTLNINNEINSAVAGTVFINTSNAAGNFSFGTGGAVPRLRISSLGVVSVGTTSPITDPFILTNQFQQLQVGKSGVMGSYTNTSGETMISNNIYVGSTHNTFQALDSGANGMAMFLYNDYIAFKSGNTQANGSVSVPERMRINSSGNVGIGVTNPAAKLQVEGTGDLVRLVSTNDGVGGAQMDMLQFSTSPADNDIMGLINMGGYYSGTSSAYFSSIRTIATDVSARKGALSFFTRSEGSFTEKMRITSGGDVKISQGGSFSIGSLTSEAKTQTEHTGSVDNGGKIILSSVSDGMSSATMTTVTIFGANNVNGSFYDIIVVAANSPTFHVLHSLSYGTAPSRTYSMSFSVNQLHLTMGSSSYNVNVKSEAMGYPF